jgi:hypothetical protein
MQYMNLNDGFSMHQDISLDFVTDRGVLSTP